RVEIEREISENKRKITEILGRASSADMREAYEEYTGLTQVTTPEQALDVTREIIAELNNGRRAKKQFNAMTEAVYFMNKTWLTKWDTSIKKMRTAYFDKRTSDVQKKWIKTHLRTFADGRAKMLVGVTKGLLDQTLAEVKSGKMNEKPKLGRAIASHAWEGTKTVGRKLGENSIRFWPLPAAALASVIIFSATDPETSGKIKDALKTPLAWTALAAGIAVAGIYGRTMKNAVVRSWKSDRAKHVRKVLRQPASLTAMTVFGTAFGSMLYTGAQVFSGGSGNVFIGTTFAAGISEVGMIWTMFRVNKKIKRDTL
ncbi:MAG: hypothetical protein Q7S22_02385, partial [Candidatus Micrarchaeota archaeon]|nr:hypothetical protein [Candidatus Micrarchaeota archaeon]